MFLIFLMPIEGTFTSESFATPKSIPASLMLHSAVPVQRRNVTKRFPTEFT